MKTQLIASEEWLRFCEEFSRQHRGWLATTSFVDEASASAGSENQITAEHGVVRDIPFHALRFEPSKRDLLMLLEDGNTCITQPISAATRICLLETEEGAHAGLRIDRAGGGTIMLRFRAPARPESLDGIAASE